MPKAAKYKPRFRSMCPAAFGNTMLAVRAGLLTIKLNRMKKTKIVCFCGSTRFAQYFMIERWKLEKQGIITLGINILPDGYFAGENHHGAEQEGVKDILDELHKRKIDISDEVVILNVGGYIGQSTKAELEYAIEIGKPVSYLEPLT